MAIWGTSEQWTLRQALFSKNGCSNISSLMCFSRISLLSPSRVETYLSFPWIWWQPQWIDCSGNDDVWLLRWEIHSDLTSGHLWGSHHWNPATTLWGGPGHMVRSRVSFTTEKPNCPFQQSVWITRHVRERALRQFQPRPFKPPHWQWAEQISCPCQALHQLWI
jgi:hypothetical protein